MSSTRRNFLKLAGLGALAFPGLGKSGATVFQGLESSSAKAALDTKSRPNVIFLLCDDLGYGDIGCYGQQKIKTPNLDRMAREGLRFTQAYAGTSVCAPTRCALMTGLHIGHAPIRANRELKPEGQEPLPAGTFTVAHLFKQAGYATAMFGKWGLGFVGSSGAPDKMGFDEFFGYNCQRQAHNYYPNHLWHNQERVALDGKTYSHDLIAGEMFTWVRAHAQQPFFLYVPFTIPHTNLQVPDLGAYAHESWPEPMKKYAAMITRMDATCGELFTLLKELKLDEQTLVIFSSDQGADNPQVLQLFQSNGPFRGGKRTMYEGGLRVPMLCRWPGHIPAGTTNATQWAFYDFLPTCAALLGQPLPTNVKSDGLSVLPAMLEGKTIAREFLYWELHEGKFIQSVRVGNWKAVRNGPDKPLELYDLSRDNAEAHDVAAEHADLAQQLTALMQREHVPNPLWPDTPAGKRHGKNTS
ncbi:MAG: arylsulfatase [Verrucomicrobia bacterium]|nr:MAG: arylsulfatase [Verrucomicrobiota bacterium]